MEVIRVSTVTWELPAGLETFGKPAWRFSDHACKV
jgi:hypothetical protein